MWCWAVLTQDGCQVSGSECWTQGKWRRCPGWVVGWLLDMWARARAEREGTVG